MIQQLIDLAEVRLGMANGVGGFTASLLQAERLDFPDQRVTRSASST